MQAKDTSLGVKNPALKTLYPGQLRFAKVGQLSCGTTTTHGLTRLGSKSIVPAMLRKFIAGSFVALWLLLVGVDLSGDAGLIQQYRGSETDRAVDSVLTNYGQATNISREAQLTIPPVLTPLSGAVSPTLIHDFLTACIERETNFSRKDIPLYKLLLVFLI